MGDIEVLEPVSLKDVMRKPDWKLWKKAIEKLVTLKEARTWKLVDVPISINIIGCKWIFKVKKNAAEIIFCYKTCLVIQEFSQVLGINYFDIYTPIDQLLSIHTILVINTTQDMEIYQIDIKRVYLNGKLTDDKVIYIR